MTNEEEDPFAGWTPAEETRAPADANATGQFAGWTAIPQPKPPVSPVPSAVDTNLLYGRALMQLGDPAAWEGARQTALTALQPTPGHVYSELLPFAWNEPDQSGTPHLSLPNFLRTRLTEILTPSPQGQVWGYQPDQGYGGTLSPAGGLIASLGARPFGGPAMAPPEGNAVAPAKLPPPYPSYPNPPQTAAAAKQIASLYYTAADRLNTQYSPKFSNDWLDAAGKIGPQSLGEKLTVGNTDVTDLLSRWEQFRDKPMSLQDIQGIDEGLGKLISKNYVSDPGTARELTQLQSALRAKTLGATAGDVSEGSPAGAYALQQGRAAYSQAMKMADLEEIDRRASVDPDKYAASVKSQLTALLKNDARTRGYTDNEIAAVKDAMSTGTMGYLAQVFGSKLLGGLAGSHYGPIGTVVGTLGSEAASRTLGNFASMSRQQQLANALNIMGQSVPVNPLGQP
jgi:hypothetical protein